MRDSDRTAAGRKAAATRKRNADQAQRRCEEGRADQGEGQALTRRARTAGFAMFLAGLALTGCGTSADEHAARSATERFYAAVRDHEGRTACALLDDDTSSQLVKDEQRPDCASAVLELELHGSQADSVSVYATSAQVHLSGGDTVFRGFTRNGWRIDAVGCRTVSGGGPLRCEESSVMRHVRVVFVVYVVLIAAGLGYAIALGFLGH